MSQRGIYLFFLAAVLTIAAFTTTAQAQPAPLPLADCPAMYGLEKIESMTASPRDVYHCQRRAYDPPLQWRQLDGKNKGTKVGGGGGFGYGAVIAPENSPAARNARASVSRRVIESACSFPFPTSIRFSLPPRAELRGSCLRFLNGVFEARDEQPPSAYLPGADPNDTCPAENDNTGLYGPRNPLTAGATATPCGAMVPSTNRELVLNINPTGLAVVDRGLFAIRIYRRGANNQYQLTQNVPLPSYLCTEVPYGDTTIWQKSMDLTPPTSQVLTFNAESGALVIRLQTRANMDPSFIPPYNDGDPEQFLVLPIDGNGNVDVPTQASCPAQAIYSRTYDATGARQDIRLQPDRNADCEGITPEPTAFNDAIVLTCRAGATLDAARNQCFMDDTGAPSPALTVRDNWVAVCPDDPAYGGPRTLTNPPHLPLAVGTCPACSCPHAGGIPPQVARCANGSTPVNGMCSDMQSPDPTLTGYQIEPTASCGQSSVMCDIVTLPTLSPACLSAEFGTQFIQYGVLNRPNIHYPEGSTATIDRVNETNPPDIGRTPAAISNTVDNSRFFTLPQTTFSIEATAPTLLLNEGGTITLNDGSVLIMNPSARLEPLTGNITMNGGGQHVSAGGTQLRAFVDGENYNPGVLLPRPIVIRVSRSVTLPAGFGIPSMSTSARTPAYMRMPAAPLPQ